MRPVNTKVKYPYTFFHTIPSIDAQVKTKFMTLSSEIKFKEQDLICFYQSAYHNHFYSYQIVFCVSTQVLLHKKSIQNTVLQ